MFSKIQRNWPYTTRQIHKVEPHRLERFPKTPSYAAEYFCAESSPINLFIVHNIILLIDYLQRLKLQWESRYYNPTAFEFKIYI